MFSMYIESRAQISSIKLYVEFEQSEVDRNIVHEDYNSDSEEEFESNYEVVGPDGDEDQGDNIMAPDVADVVNALANEVPFEEPSFMRVLDLNAMHVPEFPEYMSAKISIVADGEFAVGIEFSSREAVIKAMKDYTIRRSVDYQVYESEPFTFYAKCTQYGSGCDWHAEPQLYCPILPKSRSRGRYFQRTLVPNLSPNKIVPINNMMWHFTYLCILFSSVNCKFSLRSHS
ncbi:hypothetical protein Ahy_A07g036270 [Arachis hypogaea]|uniref:Transposase MuDR plant domain-containing protein n=1 Tax=Arachis hypogaea TaxID=3818 RepID=A0A445CFR7_ARAHY|nr:hypothetical protein Ahy_A07g036270 [Arachis hypogaea]